MNARHMSKHKGVKVHIIRIVRKEIYFISMSIKGDDILNVNELGCKYIEKEVEVVLGNYGALTYESVTGFGSNNDTTVYSSSDHLDRRFEMRLPVKTAADHTIFTLFFIFIMRIPL